MKAAMIRDDRVRSLNNNLESLARDMFRDREIDEPELVRLLTVARRSDAEIALIKGIVWIERSRPRRLGRAQMEAAFRQNLISLDELGDFYLKEGYSERDAVLLEQLVLTRKLKDEERERLRAAAREESAKKDTR